MVWDTLTQNVVHKISYSQFWEDVAINLGFYKKLSDRTWISIGIHASTSTLTFFLTCPFGQLTKKSTCPTQSFSCPKICIKNYKNQTIIIMLISIEGHSLADFDTQSAFNRWWTTMFKASWIQFTLVNIQLPLRWACYSRTKLRNWRLDTHTMMASFDTNDLCLSVC
jgi:hypothetical protein